ncbi:MAG: hypothetical protein MI757_07235, partial [Pirellulales bacterium]|nr:hypothetical protein [Pirellulales bacterium]
MLDEMRRVIGRVRYYEDIAVRQRKVASAKYDEAKATRGLAVSTGKSTVEAQEVVDERKKVLDEWLTKVETIETQRLALDKILAAYTEPETEAVKDRDRVKSDVARLEAALDERELTGAREILNLPIISAFNAPLKINQIWLPELTLYNNFKHVARFDRCTTCHMFMNKSKPGAPTEPGFPQEEILTLALNTPSSAPTESEDRTLRKMYGMDLANEGLFNPNDATIRMVWTQVLDAENEIVTSLAAQSGLQMADVIVRINGQQVRPSQKGGLSVTSAEVARDLLLNPTEWGKPIELTIRRGFPQPFQTHPRLDLYMADSSPHPMQKFGCTICHEGQGSATEFKWASHTPNSLNQMSGFKKQGWFDNHHWIFPMFPERFTEASCLKCHHTVTELEPSERFPDPPAPKLVKGYNLIREYGCFGCHEINGYDGPDKRIGPDMRLEPNYFAAAAQLLQDPGLTSAERAAAERLVTHPGDNETRRKLYDWLLTDYLSVARALHTEHASRGDVLSEDQVKLVEAVIDDPEDRAARQTLAKEIQDGKLAIAGDTNGARPRPARLADGWQALAALLKDSDTPGDMRKVGPSLRHVARKVDNDYLYAWIKKPSDLRPDTRMPQFFGLHDHLAKDPEHEDHVAYSTAQKFEPLEIRSMTHYLMKASQEFEYLKPEESITEAPSAERGKALFESRGCLACHKQTEDFPEPDAIQGPNLTLVGAKFANRPGEKTVDWGKAKDWGEGKRWLYTWLRKPSHYNPRTRMPDVILEPIKSKKQGEDGTADSSTVTDPAADIVEYLAVKRKGDPEPGKMPEVDLAALDELLTEHLGKSFTQTQVADYLQKGIHDRDRSNVKVDEIELLSDGSESDAELLDKKLMYLGRRSIGKYGCSGCHDIPGFEDAKPIGAALADWGRKDPSKLAFEHISKYIAKKHDKHARAEADAKHGSGDDGHAHDGDDHDHDSHSMSAASDEPENLRRERRDYLEHMLLSHHRMGFLWQKITEPRSYDYKMAKNKPYNDRLRMPKFPFKDDEIEAIMTFVLGLVAEPPRAQYVFQPDRDTKAIIEGRKVLATFNCAGCHQMQRPKWNIEYAPG